MSANILKEYLISIGFDISDEQMRKFNSFMSGIEETFTKIAIEGATAALTLSGEITHLAEEMENLFYVSQRTGTSASGIRAFQFGAEQIGLTAEQATGALENFARAVRLQPGLKGVLASFGIDPNQKDRLKQMMQLVNVLRRKDPALAARYGQLFGIDDRTLYQLTTYYDQLQKTSAAERERARAMGLTDKQFQALTSRSRDAMNQLRSFARTWGDMALIMLTKFLPVMERVLSFLFKVTNVLLKLNDATHGWSTALLGVAAALGIVSTAAAGIKGVGLLLGLGSGAATGGVGAATGGLGAVLTAVLGSITVIVAAVAAAYELYKNKTAVEAGGKGLLESLGLPSFKPGQYFNSLTDLVKSFEGHAKGGYGVYKDEAGIDTVGFGHRVKPGEQFGSNFGLADASTLLAKDLGDSLRVVMRSLGGSASGASQGELKALTDFEFNVGEGAFQKSSVLRDYLAGNKAGAAADLAKWDKIHKGGVLVSSAALQARRSAEAQMFTGGGQGPVSVSQKTEININGHTGNGTSLASDIAKKQQQVNGDLVRNLQGALQ